MLRLLQGAATLEEVLGDELNVTALRFFSLVEGGFSGNEIARRTGTNQSSMRKALERLVGLGVLYRSNVGRTARYELNSRRALVRYCVLDLFRSEQGLREHLIENVRNHTENLGPGVIAVILYGSVATGERTWRDIDLLVVADAKARKSHVNRGLEAADQFIREAFGIPLSSRIVSRSYFSSAAGKRLVQTLRDGGVQLHGDTILPMPDLPRLLKKKDHWP